MSKYLCYFSLKELMVIAICETKKKDIDSHILFASTLNEIVTVCNGGLDNVLFERKRSYLFHWEQSLQKHTTPLYEEPILHGDKETMQIKRGRGTLQNSSHRTCIVMECRQHKEHWKIAFETQDRTHTYLKDQALWWNESRQHKERDRSQKIAFETQHRIHSYLNEQFFDVNARTMDDDIGEGNTHDMAYKTPSNIDGVVKFHDVTVTKNWTVRRMPTHCVWKWFGVV